MLSNKDLEQRYPDQVGHAQQPPQPSKWQTVVETYRSTTQAINGMKRLGRVINNNRGASALIVGAVALGALLLATRSDKD